MSIILKQIANGILSLILTVILILIVFACIEAFQAWGWWFVIISLCVLSFIFGAIGNDVS